jgi:membrane protease YdiL (CAAX protease family)
LLFYAALLGVALAWRTLWLRESLFFADAEAAARGVRGSDLALGLAAGAGVIAVSWVLTRSTAWGERLSRALAEVIGRPGPGAIALLAASSSVGEEAFFRGALQPQLGLVWTSLIFGAVHFVPRREFLPWTGFSVAAGFLLGGLLEATGNLAAPLAAHALVNGVNLWLLSRGLGAPGDGVDLDLDPEREPRGLDRGAGGEG